MDISKLNVLITEAEIYRKVKPSMQAFSKIGSGGPMSPQPIPSSDLNTINYSNLK